MKLEIPREHVNDVCKIGQGNACCRYLIMAPGVGFTCAKLSTMAPTIDARVETMTAQADNCEGME